MYTAIPGELSAADRASWEFSQWKWDLDFEMALSYNIVPNKGGTVESH